MKTLLLALSTFLSMAPSLQAQTDSFDIATFTAPAGWKRTASNGVIVLEDQRTRNGKPAFCQIYLFPSRAAGANVAENFQAEWNAKVAGPLNVRQRPLTETQMSPDGWTVVTGFVDVSRQGVLYRAALVVATGFGRVMSFGINMSDVAYQPEIDTFFEKLDFHPNEAERPAPATAAARVAAPNSNGGPTGNYIYTSPPGWTQQQFPDGVVLISPRSNTGEQCRISLLQMRPAGGNLAGDAINIFREIFKADPMTTYPFPAPKLTRGVSAQGWEYFMVKKSLGQYGEGSGAIVLIAQLGGQIAVILGQSKEFTVSSCMGELIADAWPTFFYSLRFKNWTPSGKEANAIKEKLAGTWTTATGTVADQYTFLPNGRYAGAAATQTRARISSTEVLQTTQAFFGDGSYSFEGNRMTLIGDDKRRTASFFRLEQESQDGRTWADRLCMLQDGISGEICYAKDR